MAEKEVKVKVTTDVDKSDIEDLEETLQKMQDNKVVISPEVESMELDEVEARIEELEQKRADIYMGVDDSDLEEVEAELEELEARQIELTVNVDGSGLDEINDKLDETESKSQQATSGIDGIGSALTAVAGAAGLEQMVTTADNINNSWNRLSLTFAGTGVSIDQLKQKQSELSASTGQTGGTIRNFFNDMGIAGVTNTNLLSSAFESLSGKAYQTGQSVESMESKFQRMVMSGNASSRMLVSMGITAQDLANAMGVSADQVSEAFKNMTPEERIQALTKAMGDGKQANEMYKNSFQGLKTQAQAALAGLVGAVGQAILPVIIPMMKLATQVITNLTNGFKALPKPVQQIIGGLGGVALAAVTLIGVLGTVGTIVKTLKSGIEALNGIMRIWQTVTKAVELAQAALNLVMAMNPVVLIIIAIIALIAILWYLYNTCEPVRNAIDAIWAGVSGAIQPIIESVQWLIDKLTQLANGDWTVTIEIIQAGASAGVNSAVDMANNDASRGLISMLMGDEALAQIDEYLPAFQEKLTTSINDMLNSIWNDGTQGFLGWLASIAGIDVGSYFANLQQTFSIIPQWVNQAGQGVIQGFQGMFSGISGWLNSIISNVAGFGSRLISNLVNSASSAVNNFLSRIRQMPGAFAAELQKMIQQALDFAARLPQIIGDAARNALAQWFGITGEGSPGYMYYAFEEDLGAMENISENNSIASNIGATADRMLTNWGNPQLNVGNGSGGGSGQVTNNYTFNLYGDIDNEERMERIINEVRKAMDWNNATAGRTV